MTESEIMEQVYTMYEGDVEGWDSSSDEYLAARRYGNAGVNRWEFYENTKWPELYTNLEDAADGDKTIVALTYAYDAPSNFRFLTSYVTTTDTEGLVTFWDVRPARNVMKLKESTANWCYVTGNKKTGYKINFNPKATFQAGDTIHYDFYQEATKLTSPSTVLEISDPFAIVFFILYRMYMNDGDTANAQESLQNAEERFEQMRTETELTPANVNNSFMSSLADDGVGFGE